MDPLNHLIDEIDSLLAPRGTRTGRELPDGALPMSWAMLISILIAVFNQRMTAGWPLLKKLLERLGGQVQADAEAAGDLVIGAAPDTLKAAIVQFLQKQRESSGVVMKLIYTLLLNVLPNLLDGVWDELFAQGRVPAVFAAYPVIFETGEVLDEEAAFAAFASANDMTEAELTSAIDAA